MPYIQDWGSTPSDRRLALTATCVVPSCGHPRYRHGTAELERMGGWKGAVSHTPGPCELCRCRGYYADAPITRDDAHEQLASARTLEDLFD